MKPKVDDKKCGASESGCKAMKACPVEAISYIEVAEPISDRNVECGCTPSDGSESCGCDCDCGGNLCGRIVIDYDKCIECGVCADECCGAAIEMI